jgi:hypothetical protein
MRRFACFSIPLTLLVVWNVFAEETPPRARDRTAIAMQAKLKAIHDIAEGLVCKNFESIERSGVTLSALSAGTVWENHGDSVYGDYRQQLHRESNKISELARLRNLEGATYGYMKLISTCVECHSHCRDVLRIAEIEPVLRPVPAPVEGGGDRRMR